MVSFFVLDFSSRVESLKTPPIAIFSEFYLFFVFEAECFVPHLQFSRVTPCLVFGNCFCWCLLSRPHKPNNQTNTCMHIMHSSPFSCLSQLWISIFRTLPLYTVFILLKVFNSYVRLIYTLRPYREPLS